MSLFDKLNPKNFFTKEEISVLLFLLIFTMIGIASNIYLKYQQPDKSKIQFEKTPIDSILVAVFSDEKIEKSEIISTNKKKNH